MSVFTRSRTGPNPRRHRHRRRQRPRPRRLRRLRRRRRRPPARAPLEERDLTLKVGTILPQTGNLAFLGPPEEAGVGLAAADINEADLGITIPEIVWGDSGNTDNKAYETTLPRLLSEGVDAMIGAASSGVTKLFLDEAVARGHRVLAGQHLARLHQLGRQRPVLADGSVGRASRARSSATCWPRTASTNVATIYLERLVRHRSEPGLQGGLRGSRWHGRRRSSRTTPATPTFDSQISAVLAEDPDAIVLITFDEIYTIGPGAARQRATRPRTCTSSTETCKQFGTDPSGRPNSAWRVRRAPRPLGPATPRTSRSASTTGGWPRATRRSTSSRYANESYDATILLALAALAANSTEGADIAAKLRRSPAAQATVRSARRSRSARTSSSSGGVADYDGFSGPITFDEDGDPTEATVGVFQYGADNKYVRTDLG